jgi:hypothetical protein
MLHWFCHCWKHWWKASFGISLSSAVAFDLMFSMVVKCVPIRPIFRVGNSQKSLGVRCREYGGWVRTGMLFSARNSQPWRTSNRTWLLNSGRLEKKPSACASNNAGSMEQVYVCAWVLLWRWLGKICHMSYHYHISVNFLTAPHICIYLHFYNVIN